MFKKTFEIYSQPVYMNSVYYYLDALKFQPVQIQMTGALESYIEKPPSRYHLLLAEAIAKDTVCTVKNGFICQEGLPV